VDDPLELETRRRIYQHLQAHAGAHMREIGRVLAIPMGTLEYHLHYLVKANLLTTREDARYTRYFATGELSRRDKDVLAILRQKVPRQLAAYLLLAPGSSHGALLTKFDLSASTLSFHLKKLVTTGIVVQEKAGRENLYRVVEPELVARVLIQHRASFFDDVVDRFAEVWLNLEPRAPSETGGNGGAGGVLAVLRAMASVFFLRPAAT
jgi:DNA-binding transcriptional ArsR family regulator